MNEILYSKGLVADTIIEYTRCQRLFILEKYVHGHRLLSTSVADHVTTEMQSKHSLYKVGLIDIFKVMLHVMNINVFKFKIYVHCTESYWVCPLWNKKMKREMTDNK